MRALTLAPASGAGTTRRAAKRGGASGQASLLGSMRAKTKAQALRARISFSKGSD